MDQQPVSFPQWKAELSLASLSPELREAFRREILSYLHYCKVQHPPASAESMKNYLVGRERQSTGPAHSTDSAGSPQAGFPLRQGYGGQAGQAREALRWFYRAAKAAGSRRNSDFGDRTSGDGDRPSTSFRVIGGASQSSERGARERIGPQSKDDAGEVPPSPSLGRTGARAPTSEPDPDRDGGVPAPVSPPRSPRPRTWRNDHLPAAADDPGRTPWERDLIKASRERGLLWRTEETYREWAVRFAAFLAPRTPYVAVGQDVADFLSTLAVNERASCERRREDRPKPPV